MDAGYGANTDLRTNITDMGLQYVAGILPNTSVWEPGNEPLAPKKSTGCGRPAKLMHRSAEHQPVSVKDLALALPSSDWRTITWREGAAEALSSRFARVRVRIAHRGYKLTDCRPKEWLVIEWPEGEKEPTKYWLSTLPSNISFHRLVDYAKLRWLIERDYESSSRRWGSVTSKDEGGEASTIMRRSASRSMASSSPRGRLFPPTRPLAEMLIQKFAIPTGYRPRGSAAAA